MSTPRRLRLLFVQRGSDRSSDIDPDDDFIPEPGHEKVTVKEFDVMRWAPRDPFVDTSIGFIDLGSSGRPLPTRSFP